MSEVRAPARTRRTRGPLRSGSVVMTTTVPARGRRNLGVTWGRAVRLPTARREGAGAVRGDLGADLQHDDRVGAQRDRRRVPAPRPAADVRAHAAGEARGAIAAQR